MPEIKFNIGAMVDVASSKELSDGLSGLQGHIDRSLLRHHCQPIRRGIRSAGVVNAAFGNDATNSLIGASNPESPSLGKLWVVRSVFILDNTAGPLAASQAGIVGALCVGDPATPSPVDATGYTFTGLPAAATFNSTSIVVEPNQSIYVILGTTTTNNLAFNAIVDEWNDNEFQASKL